MKKIPRNPYAGDKGDLLPGTARALELARDGDIGAAQVALCRALATERLVVPAPVPRPPFDIMMDKLWSWAEKRAAKRRASQLPSRFVGDAPDAPWHASGVSVDNYFRGRAHDLADFEILKSRAFEGMPESAVACVSESLGTRYSPFGGAVSAYSSAQALRKLGTKFDRPALMNPARVALAALTSGGNLWLDPMHGYGCATDAKEAFRADPLGSCETIILGRNALTALACEDDWLAPWDDPEVPGLLACAVAHTGCEIVASEPFPAGGLNLKLRVLQSPDERKLALKRFQRALARDPKLTARVTYFSLTPA